MISATQPAYAPAPTPVRRDGAERWNATFPPGTPVVLCGLPHGGQITDHTASPAVQWGSRALVTLRSTRGLWDVSQLATQAEGETT